MSATETPQQAGARSLATQAWKDAAVARRAALIEDVEWMVSTGEHPENIYRRLGMSRGTVERQLLRAGRRDLARYVRVTPDARKTQGPTRFRVAS